ncbi:lytic transglycosylase domain-containing protein [uncultured Gilvimarinus sp.]|uniref:lytic transglycosylase domain-containing protein n=1 Tax=uncultured Gilvimarinus sp. TaxID=1689143 RepID=UPI0030DB6EEF
MNHPLMERALGRTPPERLRSDFQAGSVPCSAGGIASIVILVGVALLMLAQCQPATASTVSAQERPTQSAPERHRNTLVRAARFGFGMDAPIATLAAQVHQESRWQPNAKSPVGAQGIAQFMPATADWMAELYPNTLGPAQPFNPGWALRAMVQYDKWLLARVSSLCECDQWAMVLAAYNGGLGWVYRDSDAARALGAREPLAWRDIEHNNAGRSAANFKENRHYVRVVLTRFEPQYSGWGRGVCDGVTL